VGETLQRERLRAALSLDDVSAATKIAVRLLRAIEAEDFEVLPGVVFTRNFVRQYAAFLNLNPAPLLEMLPRFDLESAPLPQPPDRPRRSSWDPRWNSALASVAWTVLAGGAAVGAYVHFNRPLQPITTVHAARAPQPVRTAAAAPTPQTADPVPAAATAPADSHPVQVAVTARQDAWVQAVADGKYLFSTVLKAGETRPIGADESVRIRTGNAGGIEISLNGKPIDPLGPEGQVRSVTLTAEGPQPQPAPATPAAQDPPTETSPL
jgi:cytoskeletal protein RodZ